MGQRTAARCKKKRLRKNLLGVVYICRIMLLHIFIRETSFTKESELLETGNTIRKEKNAFQKIAIYLPHHGVVYHLPHALTYS